MLIFSFLPKLTHSSVGPNKLTGGISVCGANILLGVLWMTRQGCDWIVGALFRAKFVCDWIMFKIMILNNFKKNF